MKQTLFFLLAVLVIGSACNLTAVTQPQPTPDIAQTLDAARTQAVETALAMVEDQPTATQAPPTLEPQATATLPPVEEPTATPEPTATATPEPTATATEVPPTATPTITPLIPTATPTRTATATAAALKPSITIVAVEKNRAVTLKAENFPKNQVFSVRVGPFQNFFNNAVAIGSIDSEEGGEFLFTIFLPIEVRDVDMITVRLDSVQGSFAFNAFKNQDVGKVSYEDVSLITGLCEISVSPRANSTFPPRADFDAVWTVKNTSKITWEDKQVDYKYLAGVEMQKYEKLYDLPETVKPGDTIKIVVDIIAPDKAGDYTTHWAIVKDRTILCYLPLTITVK